MKVVISSYLLFEKWLRQLEGQSNSTISTSLFSPSFHVHVHYSNMAHAVKFILPSTFLSLIQFSNAVYIQHVSYYAHNDFTSHGKGKSMFAFWKASAITISALPIKIYKWIVGDFISDQRKVSLSFMRHPVDSVSFCLIISSLPIVFSGTLCSGRQTKSLSSYQL